MVQERIGRGARRIKLKIKPGRDVQPLDCFRKHWPNLELMVDANNAYDYHRDGPFLTGIGMTVNTAVSSWPNMKCPNAVYANAGFLQTDLIDPPTVVDADGRVVVPVQAGLGVVVDEKTLARFTIERLTLRP